MLQVRRDQVEVVVGVRACPPQPGGALDAVFGVGYQFDAGTAGGQQQRLERVVGCAVEDQTERGVDEVELQQLPGHGGVAVLHGL